MTRFHEPHPCRCDDCYKARDAELTRNREGMAQMLEGMIPDYAPGGARIGIAIAARAIRRGRPLTDAEKMENLKAALAEE